MRGPIKLTLNKFIYSPNCNVLNFGKECILVFMFVNTQVYYFIVMWFY